MSHTLYPFWKEIVVYAADGPQPQILLDTKASKVVLVGLEAGQKIPPHPEGQAVFHFLEGSGAMIVDGERLTVGPGVTVVVPAGAARGMEADTRLAFLGVLLA